jgi:hypothetical protein
MRALRLAALAAYRELMVATGRSPRAADHLVHGWREMRRHPEVIRDLCTMGHLFEPDTDPETGLTYPDAELRVRSARKSMALALLARAEITNDELSIIRTEQRYDDLETPSGTDL